MVIHPITNNPEKLQEMLGNSEANPGWSDEILGKFLLGIWLIAEADRHGIDHLAIPDELANEWVSRVTALEAAEIANIPLEKALHLAAIGNFAKAGQIFRAFMWQSANREFEKKYAKMGLNRKAQSMKFGLKGSESNKQTGKLNRKAVFDAAKLILEQSTRRLSDRNLATRIATATKIPFNTVRVHLTKLRKEKKLD